MKKITVLFALLLFVSCSDDDSQPSVTTPNVIQYFHPPAWIHGKWKLNNEGSYYEFSANDFCTITVADTRCYLYELNNYHTGSPVSVSETVLSTQYRFIMTWPGSSTTLDFRKDSDTQIRVMTSDGYRILSKVN